MVRWTDPSGPPVAGWDVNAVDHYLDGTKDDARHIDNVSVTHIVDPAAAIPANVWYVDYEVWNLDTADRGAEAWPPSSKRLKRAALLRAARWWLIAKAPLGVLEGDLGSVYVSRVDTEISDLMEGLRGEATVPYQEWPTVDDVATEALNLAGASVPTSKLPALSDALAAAVEWVTVRAEQSFGLA